MNVALLLVAFLQVDGLVFETDLWPGEGRPVFEAASKVLKLRDRPTASSRISKTLTVSPNQHISFDHTRYQTIRTGRIRILGATRVSGRMIGAVRRLSRDEYYSGKFAPVSVEVRAGMTLEYLQDRAEGTCFIRLEGRVIEADCPASIKSLFEVETTPTTEWWIHVVLPDHSGWLPVNDSNVKQVGREF